MSKFVGISACRFARLASRFLCCLVGCSPYSVAVVQWPVLRYRSESRRGMELTVCTLLYCICSLFIQVLWDSNFYLCPVLYIN